MYVSMMRFSLYVAMMCLCVPMLCLYIPLVCFSLHVSMMCIYVSIMCQYVPHGASVCPCEVYIFSHDMFLSVWSCDVYMCSMVCVCSPDESI